MLTDVLVLFEIFPFLFFFCFLFFVCFFSFSSRTVTFHQCIRFISLLIFVSFCLIICVILYALLHSTNRYVETNINFAVRCFKLLGRLLYVSFFCYIYNSDNVFVVTHFLCDFICLFFFFFFLPQTFLFSAL